MSATIEFVATGTGKWLKVTDNINPLFVDEWYQGLRQEAHSMTVSTFDETNGEVKVEVKRRDAKDYSVHSDRMPVKDGEEYPIDDSNLPKIKDETEKTANRPHDAG